MMCSVLQLLFYVLILFSLLSITEYRYKKIANIMSSQNNRTNKEVFAKVIGQKGKGKGRHRLI